MKSLIEMLSKKSVLLVDDDYFLRDSMSFYFNDDGVRFVSAGTAEEALEILQTSYFDLMILDYKFPEMSGIELLANLKTIDIDMFIIFITAYGNKEIFSQAIKYGANATLEKPLTIEKLEENIRAFFPDNL